MYCMKLTEELDKDVYLMFKDMFNSKMSEGTLVELASEITPKTGDDLYFNNIKTEKLYCSMLDENIVLYCCRNSQLKYVLVMDSNLLAEICKMFSIVDCMNSEPMLETFYSFLESQEVSELNKESVNQVDFVKLYTSTGYSFVANNDELATFIYKYSYPYNYCPLCYVEVIDYETGDDRHSFTVSGELLQEMSKLFV